MRDQDNVDTAGVAGPNAKVETATVTKIEQPQNLIFRDSLMH